MFKINYVMKNILLSLLLLLYSCNGTKQDKINELQEQISLLEIKAIEQEAYIRNLKDQINSLININTNYDLMTKECNSQIIAMNSNLIELSRKAEILYAEMEREYIRRGLLISIAESIQTLSELIQNQTNAIYTICNE